jgi:hypothetical protein
MIDRTRLSGVAGAVAILRHQGWDFFPAFDEVFNSSNLNPADKAEVMREVGSILNDWLQKKRRSQSRPVVNIKPVARKDTQEDLTSISRYPD